MSIFGKIFGGKKKPLTLADKLLQLKDSPASELESLYLGKSGAAEDLELRSALVEKVGAPTLFIMGTSDSQNADIVKQARKRIAILMDEGTVSDAEVTSAFKDTEQRLTIAALCTNDAFQTRVLSEIQDEALICKLCRSATSSKVRQLLASKIESPLELRELSLALKTKDKKAYKILKVKLDVLREEEHKREDKEEAVSILVDEMIYLAKRGVDKDTQPRLNRLQRRWSELGDISDSEVSAQFAAEVSICQEKLDAVQNALKAEVDLKAKVLEAGDKRGGVLNALWALVTKLYELENADELAITELRLALTETKAQWDELKTFNKPAAKQLRDYTLIGDGIEMLISEYEKHGSLIICRNRVASNKDDEAQKKLDIKTLRRLLQPISSLSQYPVCEVVTETNALLQRVDADFATQKENHEKTVRAITSLIRKSSQAIDQGRLKQAIGVRHSIDEKIELLDSVPSFLPKKLETLDEQIQKLVDWQAYAVVPKKQSLVASMEKLVGLDVPPEALAIKIKKLQDEWKSLSQSGKDRQEELWEKFRELADKAYVPCKVFYDELGDLRKTNLEKRKELVRQLEDFHADYQWEDADWKHVEQILRSARKELHSYAPVERAANKEIVANFDLAMDKLQEKLNEEFAKNKAAKEVLIGQAKKMSELKDIQQGIEGVKRLQAQWKMTGRCQYRDNESLWKEFRAFCDQIFEAKTQAENEKRSAADEIINNARAFITNIQALTEKPAAELLAARSDRDRLQNAFSELEEIPENVQRAIERDFNKGLDSFDNKVAKLLRESASHAWQDFFAACEKINHYHNTALSGEDDNGLREEVETFIEGVRQWPEGAQSFVKQKLLQVTSQPAADSVENLKALKILCIRAEILSDQETPETDKQLRMEYQVSLLQKGLGGQRDDRNTSLTIAKEWCGVGPVSEDEYKALFERFYMSWSAITA